MQTHDRLSVQTLVELGLTELQAKIYLAAVILHKAAVGKIAALSKVARPDVYRVLPALEENGLIKKIIASPTVYEATPLKQGCDLLLQRKKAEYTQVQEKTNELIDEFNRKNQFDPAEQPKDNFELVTSPQLLLEMLANENAFAKESIDVMGYWVHLRPLVFGAVKFFTKALKRGVKIRVISDKPSDRSVEMLTNPLFEMRVSSGPVIPKMVIYDGKKANMFVGASSTDIAPSLWSDNPEFVKVISAYFENTWAQSEVAGQLQILN